MITTSTSNQAIEVIRSYIDNLIGTLGGVKGSLALAGIILISIIIVGYMIYGFYKFLKLTFRLRPHEFALVMLALGLSLIVIAVIMP